MKERLNIELLTNVRDKIAATPESYDQTKWGRKDEAAPCGTAACVAGWAAYLSNRMTMEELQVASDINYSVGDVAAKELGLYSYERAVLFAAEPAECWPQPFADDWDYATSVRQKAAVAVAFLNEIIETEEVREPEDADDEDGDDYDDNDD